MAPRGPEEGVLQNAFVLLKSQGFLPRLCCLSRLLKVGGAAGGSTPREDAESIPERARIWEGWIPDTTRCRPVDRHVTITVLQIVWYTFTHEPGCVRFLSGRGTNAGVSPGSCER